MKQRYYDNGNGGDWIVDNVRGDGGASMYQFSGTPDQYISAMLPPQRNTERLLPVPTSRLLSLKTLTYLSPPPPFSGPSLPSSPSSPSSSSFASTGSATAALVPPSSPLSSAPSPPNPYPTTLPPLPAPALTAAASRPYSSPSPSSPSAGIVLSPSSLPAGRVSDPQIPSQASPPPPSSSVAASAHRDPFFPSLLAQLLPISCPRCLPITTPSSPPSGANGSLVSHSSSLSDGGALLLLPCSGKGVSMFVTLPGDTIGASGGIVHGHLDRLRRGIAVGALAYFNSKLRWPNCPHGGNPSVSMYR